MSDGTSTGAGSGAEAGVGTEATAIARQFLTASPMVTLLGITEVELGDGMAGLAMPFRDDLITVGKTVHGGAIATLADTTAACAAWAGAEMPDRIQGSTIDLTIQFLRPASGDLRSEARVIHRGKSLVRLRGEITTEDGAVVAEFLAAYKLG